MGGKTIENKTEKILGIQLNSATYGVVVPLVLGTSRIAGNIIDYYDFKAIPHTETQRTGKGGHTTIKNTSYTYEAAVLIGLAEGPSGGIGKIWVNGEKAGGLSSLNLTLFSGTYGQASWSYTQSKHPEKALPYSGLAYVAGVIDLGESGTPPVFNFEYKGLLRNTGDGIDVNPADAIAFICSDPVNGVGFGIGGIDAESLERYRRFCKAADLFISVPLTETKKAYEIINEICKATNTIVFWSQDKLKFVPKCDERLERDGVVYEPDLVPLYDLTADDFLEIEDGQLVKFEREDNAEAYNHVPVEFLNRANSYEKEIAEAKIQVDINRRGLRSMSAVDIPYLHTKKRAEYVANQMVMESLYGRNKYIFRLGWSHCLLEPGDFVTIYDPAISPDKIPVTIDSIEEDEDGALAVVAKGRPPGIYSPARYETYEAERPDIDFNVPPGPTTATVFIPSPEVSGRLETWIAVSGGENWGGCSVWVSDNGENYQQVGTIDGPSRHGVLTEDLPAGAVIDTMHTLKVELHNNLQLLSGSQEDAHNLNTLCWVDGELIAYATAILVGERRYALTYLIRGVYNTPISEHPAGSKFVRLDPHLFRHPFSLDQIGKQFYIKLTSKNIYDVAEQSLDEVEPITHVITAQTPPNVKDIFIDENTYRLKDGTVLTDIWVAFSAPKYTVLSHYNVYYDLGDGWKYSGMADGTNYIIKALPQARLIKVKITTVATVGLESEGIISEPYLIVGKDRPPSDVEKLTLTRVGSMIKAVITPVPDPDIRGYEIRMGPSWANSILIKATDQAQTEFEAPNEGSLTFWVKAIDNSGNPSANATKAQINVFGIPPKNIIFQREEDTKTWTAKNGSMYLDPWGRWKIQSKKKVRDYPRFFDMFGQPIEYVDNPELYWPEADLGPNIIEEGYFWVDRFGETHLNSVKKLRDFERFFDIFGVEHELVEPKYATQTLMGIEIFYNQTPNNRVDIEYRTRVDGDGWTEWKTYLEKSFFGRRIEVKLKPITGNSENVVISGGRMIVDVPDVEEIIENVDIPAAKTRIAFRRKFFDPPKSIAIFAADSTGKQAIWRIDPETITRDGFDLELLDEQGNQIAGKLLRASVRGY